MTEDEAPPPKATKKWFRFGCRLFHAYAPVLVFGGIGVGIVGAMLWSVFRQIILGQPKRLRPVSAPPTLDFMDIFILIALIVIAGWLIWLFLRRLFPQEACFPEGYGAWLFILEKSEGLSQLWQGFAGAIRREPTSEQRQQLRAYTFPKRSRKRQRPTRTRH